MSINQTDLQLAKQMVIALHQLPGIGWHAINKAVSSRLWTRRYWKEQMLLEAGMSRVQAQIILRANEHEDWTSQPAIPAEHEHNGIKVLTPFDYSYPQKLQEISQPPWVLYALGRMELLTRPAAAVVGTRVPTAYGRHAARKLAQELSDGAVTVVSGLARGIDSIAHETALAGIGGTIAVLPTAINECYPPENRHLYARLSNEALLLSETPFGMKLHPGQFHQRNRIIAAMSAATVVIECAAKSGSLITAKHAFEMNRELFAVPGPIHSPKSEGANELIRNGAARLISSAHQIFEELPWLKTEADSIMNNRQHKKDTEAISIEQLSSDEQKIIGLLQVESLTFDEIFERSSIPFGHLNAVLLNLCIKQKIELHPGSVYMIL